MSEGVHKTVILWILLVAIISYVSVSTTQVKTELSLLFPEGQTSKQQLLLDAMRKGPASRLILIGLEGVPVDILTEVSRALAADMRATGDFLDIRNGERVRMGDEEDLLFRYRYLLSPTIERTQFTVQGLHEALVNRLHELTTPLAAFVKIKLPADPTSEFWSVLQRWVPDQNPHHHRGVWVTPDQSKALLMAETVAAGFDLQQQRQIQKRVRERFSRMISEKPDWRSIDLTLTGPAVFAVETEKTVKAESSWFSLIALTLVVSFLLVTFRSLRLILLSLLPLLSGLLMAVFAVNLTHGFIHGITIAFGVTLIGVAVDYPIHLFSHLTIEDSVEASMRGIWPTMLLGAGTTALGYCALWFSGFPGLTQLGIFAIIGILVSAIVTRWVLPHLVPQTVSLNWSFDLPVRVAHVLQRSRSVFPILIIVPIIYLGLSTEPLWETDIANITPIPMEKKTLDQKLREAIGAPSVRDLLVIQGKTEEAVLHRSEDLIEDLDSLVQQGFMGGYDIVSGYLPSRRTQMSRQAQLPDQEILTKNLTEALEGLPFKKNLFSPFLHDVAKAQRQQPMTSKDFQDTSLELKLRSLLFRHHEDWVSVVPLRKVQNREKILQWNKTLNDPLIWYLDLKEESNNIVSTYRDEALVLLGWGGVAIGILLFARLRTLWLFPTVLLPIVSSVFLVITFLHFLGEHLSLFHLASLLLVLGLGLDYALFFNRSVATPMAHRRTIVSIWICCTTTILVFGTLAFSQIPVLRAIGLTATLGAMLSFMLSAMFSSHDLTQI